MRRLPALALTLALIPGLVAAQTPQAAAPARPSDSAPRQASAAASVERLGDNLYRIGTIRVDTGQKEISVAGKVNPDVTILEFIANTRDGAKAYETAITLDTDALTFNAALILIGLNKARSRNAPTAHFDPKTPEGDEVEIFIECPGRECQRMPAEQLIFDRDAKSVVSGGGWVYTGSAFTPDGRFLAQLDGTLVGFVHDPSSIIEYAAGAGLNRYGSIVFNPAAGLKAGTPVVLTIRAVAASGRR